MGKRVEEVWFCEKCEKSLGLSSNAKPRQCKYCGSRKWDEVGDVRLGVNKAKRLTVDELDAICESDRKLVSDKDVVSEAEGVRELTYEPLHPGQEEN